MPYIVLVHSLFNMLVVVHSVRVLEGYPLTANYPEFFVTHPPNCPIGGHHHHGTVFLFHSEYAKRAVAKMTEKYIHVYNILVSGFILDLLTIGIARPVSHIIYENGPIYSLLIYIHQYL